MSIDDDMEDEGAEDEVAGNTGGVRVTRSIRDLASKIASLLIKGRMADFDLGREIDRIYTRATYRNWLGFDTPPTFGEWSWRVLGFKERKARQMRDNFLNLSAMDLAPDSLARSLRVGWSKLTAVLRVARTEHDLLAWIDKIEDQQLTEDALTAEVRITAEKAGIEARPINTPGARQARHAERLAAADDPTEIRSTPPLPAGVLPPRSRVFLKIAFDEEEALRILIRGLDAIKRRYGEMGNGKAITLMATAYMATLPRDDQGGAPVELAMLLKAIENTYRVRLQVVPAATPTAKRPVAQAKQKAKKKRRNAAEMDD